MTWTLFADRLLAAPGRGPAERNVNLEIAGGRIAGISRSDRGRGSGGRIALPAMVNAHDHGYGLRPLALGGADDALECWIASLTRPTVEPRLEAAVAFGRMALAGVGATVHCHNSLAADRLEAEAAGVARAAADVGIRVAFSCPIRDRNPWVYGDQRALLPYLTAADRAVMEAAISDGAVVPDEMPAHRQVEQVESIAAAHESESVPGAIRPDRSAVVPGRHPGAHRRGFRGEQPSRAHASAGITAPAAVAGRCLPAGHRAFSG